MNMSSACTAPVQPDTSRDDASHPMYPAYLTYRSSMIRQMVRGLSFDSWLDRTTEKENGHEVVFHTLPGARLETGWYKHKFAPRTEELTRFGPFATQDEAQRA